MEQLYSNLISDELLLLLFRASYIPLSTKKSQWEDNCIHILSINSCASKLFKENYKKTVTMENLEVFLLPCCDMPASEWLFLFWDGNSLWKLLWKGRRQNICHVHSTLVYKCWVYNLVETTKVKGYEPKDSQACIFSLLLLLCFRQTELRETLVC